MKSAHTRVWSSWDKKGDGKAKEVLRCRGKEESLGRLKIARNGRELRLILGRRSRQRGETDLRVQEKVGRCKRWANKDLWEKEISWKLPIHGHHPLIWKTVMLTSREKICGRSAFLSKTLWERSPNKIDNQLSQFLSLQGLRYHTFWFLNARVSYFLLHPIPVITNLKGLT